MADPFLAEIRVFSFNYAPKGWALCNGQLMSIQQNKALYSLLGTTFGGDGVATFALPDLQSRVPLNPAPSFPWGVPGGEAEHVLTVGEMPAHVHEANTTTGPASLRAPGGVWGVEYADNDPATPVNAYGTVPSAAMNAAALASTGSNQAHPNLQPYLVLNFCISTDGYYPPRP